MTHPTHRPASNLHLIVALVFALIVVCVLGGLGLVGLRQQIASAASNTQRVEREITQVERRLNYLDTKIAEVNNPSFLHRRAHELGLGLQPAQTGQFVRLTVSGEARDVMFARRSERPVRERDPFVQTFDLAVMEPLRRLE
ncbi:MAG: hypothetical protein JJT96_08075 [Opitutales bacterium]|nr:hypothetical protein [Opitutales bacterium]